MAFGFLTGGPAVSQITRGRLPLAGQVATGGGLPLATGNLPIGLPGTLPGQLIQNIRPGTTTPSPGQQPQQQPSIGTLTTAPQRRPAPLGQLPEIAQRIQPAQQPQQLPTLEDFIAQAEKLGRSKILAQQDLLSQNVGDIGQALSRQLFGQNVGALSGIGSDIIQRTLERQAQRLEPTAIQVGTQLGQQALQEQIARQNEQRNRLFGLVQAGQLRGGEGAGALQQVGITDPTGFLTDPQLQLEQVAAAQGITPEELFAGRRPVGLEQVAAQRRDPRRFITEPLTPEELQQREQELIEASRPPETDFRPLVARLFG